jgi:DNA-binding transcriptional LysR family regulator
LPEGEPTVELRHLRYFIAVAEECHFGRAAERLHMAQPPLSQQIRQLEQEVGTALLERTTRRVELTPAGALFLDRARSILAAVDGATADAERAARGEIGRLSIGFTGTATYELMPTVAKKVREELPGVELELHGEMLTPAQVAGLRDGSLDVGFLRPPLRAADINVRIIRREPLVAVLPIGHRLANRASVPLAALADDPFIAYPSHFRSVMQEAVEEACRKAGFQPRVIQECSETATLVSFVAAGLGVALVPGSVRHLQVTGAVYRPLADRVQDVALALAWRAGDRSPVVGQFLAHVASVAEEPTEPSRRRRAAGTKD